MKFDFKSKLKESNPEVKLDHNEDINAPNQQVLVPVDNKNDQQTLSVVSDRSVDEPIKQNKSPDSTSNKIVDRISRNKWSFPVFLFVCSQILLLSVLSQAQSYIDLGRDALDLPYNGAEADQCFKEAAQLDSKSAELPLTAMKAFLQYNYPGDYAYDWANKAIAINPKAADAYRGLGDIAYRNQQFDLAKAQYSKALSIDKQNQGAIEGLKALEHLNDFQQAK